MADFCTLVHPTVFRMAQRLTNVTSWHGLIPVGFQLVALQSPRLLVELGTHSGDSYCAFCQAVEMTGSVARCFAIDTWQGDDQAGHYGPEVLADLRSHHDPRYSRFSTLIQDTFDDAVAHFDDGSIDFLHIDGLHTYDAVKHDFTTWKPKLSERAIVLLHDINVRQRDFGVRTFWNELKEQYRTVEFTFSHGLGVVAVGKPVPPMQVLFDLSPPEFAAVHELFEALGRRIINEALHLEQSDALMKMHSDLQAANEKTHLEWTQRIHAEEENSKLRLELDAQARRYDADLQAAGAQTHLEWTQRIRAEEDLARSKGELLESQKQKEKEVARQSAEIEGLQRKVADLSMQNQMALNSRSWKLTAPLRAGTRLLKRFRSNTHQPNGPPVEVLDPAVVTAQSEAGVPFSQEGWDRNGRARLASMLSGENYLDIGKGDQPVVSVILVLFNQAHLTLLALESIRCNADLDYELVIVDNASTDATGELLQRLRGAHFIRNTKNIGFGPACMQGAEAAQAPYLLFLNNDALLEPQAMSAALANFSRSEGVGAVGGRILLADGRLQEAGSIVWSDGSALGYGRSDNPALPAYEFRRPVDYCSGAFLFTPRSLFFELGGFKEEFAPAYYEDTDYCMRVWNHGRQVIYEPCSVIRHFESASSGGNETAKPQMAAKQLKFVELWKQSLPKHLAPAPSNIVRSRIATSFPGLRILYLDDRIPHRDLGSGFPRSNDVLRHLVLQGHHVSCVGLSFPSQQPSDEYRDIPREIELVDGTRDIASVLKSYLPAFDIVWVSRPHNMDRFLKAIADSVVPNRIPIIYDAEAIFTDRDRLKAEVEGHTMSQQMLNARSAIESALAQAADQTLAVSERDAHQLEVMGVPSVKVLGHCIDASPTENSFHERSGCLFLGAIHGEDNPNLDSLRYFCRDVWPALSNATGTTFTIAGFGTDKFADEFKISGVKILGRTNDTRPLYQSARVFVVPTRFCAGTPYKAHEAAAHGVPMVVTPIIRDQLGWTDGQDCLVAGSAKEFADKCILLLNDAALWTTLRENALRRVSSELSSDAFGCRIAGILGDFKAMSKCEPSPENAFAAITRR